MQSPPTDQAGKQPSYQQAALDSSHHRQQQVPGNALKTDFAFLQFLDQNVRHRVKGMIFDNDHRRAVVMNSARIANVTQEAVGRDQEPEDARSSVLGKRSFPMESAAIRMRY